MKANAADFDTLPSYCDAWQTVVSSFQESRIDIFLTTHHAKGQMIIAGNADNMGDYLQNLNQSRQRAKIVVDTLWAKSKAGAAPRDS